MTMATETRNVFTTSTPYGEVRVRFYASIKDELNNTPGGGYGRVFVEVEEAEVEFMADPRCLIVNGILYTGYVNLARRPGRDWAHGSGGFINRGRHFGDGEATDNARSKIYAAAFAAVAEVEAAHPTAPAYGRIVRMQHERDSYTGKIARAQEEIAAAEVKIAEVDAQIQAAYVALATAG